MRVTTFGTNARYLDDLNNVMSKYQGLESELSTGRKLNQPSDDPVGFEVDMQTQVSGQQVTQWKASADSALSTMQNNDSTMNTLLNVLGTIRTSLVQAVNGSNTQDDIKHVIAIVSQQVQAVAQTANTTDGEQYIFSGTNGKVQPITVAANGQLQWNATSGTPDKLTTIGAGVQIPVGVNGTQLFTGNYSSAKGGNTTLLNTLNTVVSDLTTASTASTTSAYQTSLQVVQNDLQDLDTGIDHSLSLQADLGGRMTRLKGAQQQLAQAQNTLATYKSSVEGADMAQVMTQLVTQQTVYQAALASGQRMIQPTLADVLK